MGAIRQRVETIGHSAIRATLVRRLTRNRLRRIVQHFRDRLGLRHPSAHLFGEGNAGSTQAGSIGLVDYPAVMSVRTD